MRRAGAEMTEQDRIDAEAVEWFTRLSDVPVSAMARAEFARWRLVDPLHAQAFDELTGLWAGLDGLRDIGLPSEEVAAVAVPRSRFIARRRALAVACAGAALAAAIPLSLPDGGVAALLANNRTAHGQMREVHLVDGSSILMDSGTALSVDMTSDKRVVHLIAGRAFFEVRHDADRPFEVAAGDSRVTDIGTAFEVSLSSTGGRVAVAEGVVDVARPRLAAARLVAGEALDLAGGAPKGEPATQIAVWREHRLSFENRPLSAVVDELRRYLPGWVILTSRDRGARRLTGSLDTHRPLAALDALAKMADLSVQRIGPVTLLRAN